MSDEIKDLLWGVAAGAGVFAVIVISGGPAVLAAFFLVLGAIAGGVIASHVRDRRATADYDRELNARYEEAERRATLGESDN
jgi:outer membrane lipoprotein SlyB